MRLPIVLTIAPMLILAACDGSYGPSDGTADKSYGDRPFWDGNVCVEIRPDGKRTIVPKTDCPARQ